MSLAADTREAVRQRPVLYDALRAGIVNYTAAADTLDLDGDREAIATALRRFAESLSEDADREAPDAADRSLTVRMDHGVDLKAVDSLPTVDDAAAAADAVATDDATESVTAIRATGDVDAALLATVCDRLRIDEIDVLAAGVAANSLAVAVPQRSGATALQIVEGVADD